MNAINWETVGTIVALVSVVIGTIWGTLKYVFHSLEKHSEHIDGRFKEHKQRLDENADAIRVNEKLINETREIMARDYMREGSLDDKFNTINEKFSGQDRMLSEIFKIQRKISANVNRLIGAHTAHGAKVEVESEHEDD